MEAEAMQREVLVGEREVLGPCHPETLKVMAYLAFTLYKLGKTAEAEELEREVLCWR